MASEIGCCEDVFQQFAYLHSVLVGHHMGIGNDESVLWYNEPGAAGYGNLPLGKHHPEKREGGTKGLALTSDLKQHEVDMINWWIDH